MLRAVTVIAHLLAADGPIPNHPRWPLLVYPAALARIPLPRCDPVHGPRGPLFDYWKPD